MDMCAKGCREVESQFHEWMEGRKNDWRERNLQQPQVDKMIKIAFLSWLLHLRINDIIILSFDETWIYQNQKGEYQ